MSESTKHSLYLTAALALFLLMSRLDYIWSVPQ